jgi:hypothetical protein
MVDQATEPEVKPSQVVWKYFSKDALPQLIRHTLRETLKQRLATLRGGLASIPYQDTDFIEDITESLDEIDDQVEGFEHLYRYSKGKDSVKLPIDQKYISQFRNKEKNKDYFILSLSAVKDLPLPEEISEEEIPFEPRPMERAPQDQINQDLTTLLNYYDQLEEGEELTPKIAQQLRSSTSNIRQVLGIPQPTSEPTTPSTH